MSNFGLRLTRSAASVQPYLNERVFRIRVEVTDVNPGTDPHVFLFHAGEPNPETGDVSAYYEKVASAYEMSEYPIDAPDPDLVNQFFRGKAVELVFPSLQAVEEFWVKTAARVDNLMGILNNLKNSMETVEHLWCGAPDENASSSSVGA